MASATTNKTGPAQQTQSQQPQVPWLQSPKQLQTEVVTRLDVPDAGYGQERNGQTFFGFPFYKISKAVKKGFALRHWLLFAPNVKECSKTLLGCAPKFFRPSDSRVGTIMICFRKVWRLGDEIQHPSEKRLTPMAPVLKIESCAEK